MIPPGRRPPSQAARHRPRAVDRLVRLPTLVCRRRRVPRGRSPCGGHLTTLGDAHAGVHFATIGWILPGVHDPDGHDVRFYTTDRHTELPKGAPLVIDDAVATAAARASRQEHEADRP